MPDAPFIKTVVKKSSGRFQQYGLMWQPTVDPISMELDMIRHGGQWEKQSGGLAGNGLYYHYRRFQELVWPERIWEKGPFKNHWGDKCLECYIRHQYIGVMGCAASGKSDSFGCNSLTEWYAWPDCTTVLVSSTDLKSLELRIWGMIKKYHKLASRMRDWIPGHLIEGKQMIIQDEQQQFKEGRDFKNGIIAVPCRKGTQFVGLGSYVGIHNKRVRLIADECFVAGTMVDTNNGPIPIELIVPGDRVKNANGFGRVIAIRVRNSEEVAIIKTRNGRKITCTPNHPFFTSSGWVKACDLSEGCLMLTANEAMRILQGNNAGKEQALLQSILLSEMDALATSHSQQKERKPVQSEAQVSGRASGILRRCVEVQLRKAVDGSLQTITFSKNEIARLEADCERRKRNRAITVRTGIDANVPGRQVELCDQNRHEIGVWISSMLQGGLGISGGEASHRSGRPFSQQPNKKGNGPEEGAFFDGDWVESIEIQKCSNSGLSKYDGGGHSVYNLQVEGHPSYSVEGLLVHNCNLMPRAFLDSTSNLSKCEDFKLVGLGNPNETTNAHGVLCEPAPHLGGWESGIDQTPGTKVWETKFPNGICLQLPGSDTPNKDSEDGEEPFPFLITPKQLREDAQIWSVDDWHYKMMDEAMMPRGQGARRVLTRQSCVKFGAFSAPKWRDSRRTSIAFLDAAYRGVGGDRCVFGELQFGPEAETKPTLLSADAFVVQDNRGERQRHIIALVDLVVVPIQAEKGSDQPEDQIVRFVMSQCETRGIPADNFFYDAGMRTSLVTAFSRIWKHVGNSIDCGGKPTEQIVSMEIQKKACDYYNKFITELWFNVRLVVESSQFRGMTEEACTEFSQREWKMSSGNKIEVETKEEMKEKTGRSPDLADAIAVGVHGARQRGFVIMRAKPEKDPVRGPDWRDDLKKKARALWNSGNLNYQA